jgi:hypothetical protein
MAFKTKKAGSSLGTGLNNKKIYFSLVNKVLASGLLFTFTTKPANFLTSFSPVS